MNTKSKEFQKLQTEWYKKLKKSGFDDIEETEDLLKWSAPKNLIHIRNRDKQHLFTIREDYYRLAGYFLHDYGFTKESDRLVWEQHVEGTSIRDISKYLKIKKVRMAPTQVKETIHRLRNVMFSKYKELDGE